MEKRFCKTMILKCLKRAVQGLYIVTLLFIVLLWEILFLVPANSCFFGLSAAVLVSVLQLFQQLGFGLIWIYYYRVSFSYICIRNNLFAQ